MHDIPRVFEITALTVVLVILAIDLLLVIRRPHVPSAKESAAWVGFYVSLALIFGGILGVSVSGQAATEFLSGWAVEYALSLDNVFVFTVIIGALRVPRRLQQRVLMIGILISLVVRGAFILAGGAVISRYSWVFYLFGIFLIITAIGMWRGGGEDEEYHENRVVALLRRFLPISRDYDGGRALTVVDGRRMLTPLVVVIIALGTTDVLFAVDSIPAIFGITQDTFLVMMATIFALMGLRQLYFLLGGLLQRLVYLQQGLGILLGYIGVSLVLRALSENTVPFLNGGEEIESIPQIPEWFSLAVIVVVLLGTAAVSEWAVRRRGAAPARRSEDDTTPPR